MKILECMRLHETYAVQQALWRGESIEAIARTSELDSIDVAAIKAVQDQQRKRLPRGIDVAQMEPWVTANRAEALNESRVQSAYSKMQSVLRRDYTGARDLLQLPPAISPDGWVLENAKRFASMLPKEAKDSPWTATIRAATHDGLADLPELQKHVGRVLMQFHKLHVVCEQTSIAEGRHVRVDLTRADMRRNAHYAADLELAAIVAVTHRRTICLLHSGCWTPGDAV